MLMRWLNKLFSINHTGKLAILQNYFSADWDLRRAKKTALQNFLTPQIWQAQQNQLTQVSCQSPK